MHKSCIHGAKLTHTLRKELGNLPDQKEWTSLLTPSSLGHEDPIENEGMSISFIATAMKAVTNEENARKGEEKRGKKEPNKFKAPIG